MKQKGVPLTEFSDRELLQLMVISLVKLEKRAEKIEQYLSHKFPGEFQHHNEPESEQLKKTMIDYHDDAMSEMESN